MHALLRVIQKQANVQQVRLLPETVIGRSVDCNLKIASTQVSRRHCRLTVNDLGVYIEDLCSANGTFLDGKRLLPNQPTLAPAGSQLVIGPATFSVEYRVSMVSLPELGASVPTIDVAIDVAPVETSSIPLADVQAAIASSSGLGLERSLPTFAEMGAGVVATPAPVEAPKRTRSLFGLFQRSRRAAENMPVAVPFLPAEPQPSAAPSDNPVVAAVAEKTPAVESGFDFTATAESPVEGTEAENPFRQFSQY